VAPLRPSTVTTTSLVEARAKLADPFVCVVALLAQAIQLRFAACDLESTVLLRATT
jgi:hypothetical protein